MSQYRYRFKYERAPNETSKYRRRRLFYRRTYVRRMLFPRIRKIALIFSDELVRSLVRSLACSLARSAKVPEETSSGQAATVYAPTHRHTSTFLTYTASLVPSSSSLVKHTLRYSSSAWALIKERRVTCSLIIPSCSNYLNAMSPNRKSQGIDISGTLFFSRNSRTMSHDSGAFTYYERAT